MLKSFYLLFFASIVIFLYPSCTPKKIPTPSYGTKNLEESLTERPNIEKIYATFSALFEKPGISFRGSGELSVNKNGDLLVKIYTLGFLSFELSSKNNIIKSVPHLDTRKRTILARGLRDCLFWWDIIAQGRIINEKSHHIRKGDRDIWFRMDTPLPLYQTITFPHNKKLAIQYDAPAYINGIWYQSKIRIEFSLYALTLELKEIRFKTEDASNFRGQDQLLQP